LEGRGYPVIAFELVACDIFGLSAGLDISATARQMFGREAGKTFLQKTAVEISVLGNDEHNRPRQINDSGIVNSLLGEHRIGDVFDVCDFGRNQEARAFEPLP